MRVLTKKRLGNRLLSYATLLTLFATSTLCIQIDLAPSPHSRKPWRISRRLSLQFFLPAYVLHILTVCIHFLFVLESHSPGCHPSNTSAHPFLLLDTPVAHPLLLLIPPILSMSLVGSGP